MYIVSQNLSNYGVPLPTDCIFRINLAWINDLDELKLLLKKHQSHEIFLDLPINRTKPPSNNYSLDNLVPIIESNSNIKYFAISNVDSADYLEPYVKVLPKTLNIIPKIENAKGISNIAEIINKLPTSKKIIMLDHDDLYSSLIKQNESPSKFKDYINNLINFCATNKITLLRTIGVVFSDDEKRVTQYIK
jgi:hypothetical protein